MGRRLGILGMDGDLFRLIGKQESQPYIFQSQIPYVYIFFLGYILTNSWLGVNLEILPVWMCFKVW